MVFDVTVLMAHLLAAVLPFLLVEALALRVKNALWVAAAALVGFGLALLVPAGSSVALVAKFALFGAALRALVVAVRDRLKGTQRSR